MEKAKNSYSPRFRFQVVLEVLKRDRKEVEIPLLRNFVEGARDGRRSEAGDRLQ